MIFESFHYKHGLTVEHKRPDGSSVVGSIQFEPGDKVLDDEDKPLVFGQFDTEDERTRQLLQATADDIQAHIEAESLYKDRVVGRFGIWPKEERLLAMEGQTQAEKERIRFDGLPDETLRIIIAGKGGAFPPDADHGTLVKLALSVHGKPAVNQVPVEVEVLGQVKSYKAKKPQP